ncbi:MAG: GNAT family N-acetyltransferase [Actinomycetota bacterium]|nr:GNAT family N-acetyltransferase [Actinomycetota bacterium]
MSSQRRATQSALTPGYAIEPAQPSDLATIRELLRQAHFDTRGLNAAHFMVVRAPDGWVLGGAQIKPVGWARVLSSVVLDTAYRRHGLGRVLVAALLASETGQVLLMCAGRLIPYYQAFGFEVVSPRRAPWGLFWRWAVLALIGHLVPSEAGAVIMARPASPS